MCQNIFYVYIQYQCINVLIKSVLLLSFIIILTIQVSQNPDIHGM